MAQAWRLLETTCRLRKGEIVSPQGVERGVGCSGVPATQAVAVAVAGEPLGDLVCPTHLAATSAAAAAGDAGGDAIFTGTRRTPPPGASGTVVRHAANALESPLRKVDLSQENLPCYHNYHTT
jgi:hypothetical protein